MSPLTVVVEIDRDDESITIIFTNEGVTFRCDTLTAQDYKNAAQACKDGTEWNVPETSVIRVKNKTVAMTLSNPTGDTMFIVELLFPANMFEKAFTKAYEEQLAYDEIVDPNLVHTSRMVYSPPTY
jgi:hypothetical protein